MAAMKTAVRQKKEETVEVRELHRCFLIVPLWFTLFAVVWSFTANVMALVTCFIRANCALLWLQRDMAQFAQPVSLRRCGLVFTPSLQVFSWASWDTDRTPWCSSRGWWLWRFPASLTSEGFSQRGPTGPDTWRVRRELWRHVRVTRKTGLFSECSLFFISPDLCVKVLREDSHVSGASKVVKW